MGRVDGKVALITGAARGQGRSHAIRLAEEGADIIAIDACAKIGEMQYPGASEADLTETVRQVEALGRRIHAVVADVRNCRQIEDALADGVAHLGSVNIVSANAGITTVARPTHRLSEETWQDVIDVNLTGVWHTTKAAIPHMIEHDHGGAIVLTSSVAGLRAYGHLSHYVAAKHGVVGLMRSLAIELAPFNIRVNSIHPTQTNTPMLMNDATIKLFSDAEMPTREGFRSASQRSHLLPVPWIEPIDVSNALLFLVSDEARYVTGVALPVDAGSMAR